MPILVLERMMGASEAKSSLLSSLPNRILQPQLRNSSNPAFRTVAQLCPLLST